MWPMTIVSAVLAWFAVVCVVPLPKKSQGIVGIVMISIAALWFGGLFGACASKILQH